MASDRIVQLFKRWERLKQDKSHWHHHWDDLARVMLPRRMGFATTTHEGERRTDDIFDGTPMQGARSLANAIGGLMRPEGLPEVSMKANDDRVDSQDEAQDWFAASELRLREAFNLPRARYRQASAEVDLDLVVFGTSILFEGENAARDSLFFQSVHLKDATPAFDEEGSAEAMYFERQMPLRQAVARFGEKNLSEKARRRFEKAPDEKIKLLHCVLPRKEGKADALFAKDFPFADLWFEIDGKHELSVGGFHEFPFIVSRWDTTSGEDFGRSPGMIALPDSDTLQAMGETILIAGQRAADPPLAVPNDGSFDAINTFPGGLAYYDVETAQSVRGNPFFPIEGGMNLPISRDMQRDAREQVFAAFFRNVLNLPVDGPEMTATEVIARKEEFMREIGPTFGKLESDRTAPEIERAFMIMLRNGGFPPIPDILAGQDIRFEYDSPVKRIRQQIEAAAALQWAEEMAQVAQFKPEALDLINVDALGRFSAESKNLPRNIVNGTEEVGAIRQARQEAEAQQRAALAAEQAMQTFKTGAEAAASAQPVLEGGEPDAG
jgi:hypothetical protein